MTDEEFDKHYPEVLDRLAEGESLRQIINSAPDRFPKIMMFLEMIEKSEDRLNHYARAREAAAMKAEDEILDLANRIHEYTEVKEGENDRGTFREKRTVDNVQRSRLKIDAIKWRYGKTILSLGNRNAVGDRGGQRFEAEYED